MSMTVKLTTSMTELELLLEALEQMGIAAQAAGGAGRNVRGRPVEATAEVSGRRIGFERDAKGQLSVVGDSDWACMQDQCWLDGLHQQYSVAAVKRKAREMHYHLASIETRQDGSIRIVARAWGE